MRLFVRRPRPAGAPLAAAAPATGTSASPASRRRSARRGPNVASVAVLSLLWFAVAAAGIYVTMVMQPRELTALTDATRAAGLKREEAGALTQQQVAAEAAMQETALRWATRYKVVPDSLRAHDVVAYLNSLSRRGFKNVDAKVTGTETSADVSRHLLEVTGRASYGALHRFVWDLENNRSFYRLRSLTIEQTDLSDTDSEGRPTFEAVVTFKMGIEALFGGVEGLSAPPPSAVLTDAAVLPQPAGNRPPVVPATVLPMRNPPRNPFYPLILSSIPPNTYGLLDVQEAELIAIADGRAIFRDSEGFHTLGAGSAVYLGYISRVDAANGRVVAHLNKGGILDQVVRRVDGRDPLSRQQRADAGDPYRPLNTDGTRAGLDPSSPSRR